MVALDKSSHRSLRGNRVLEEHLVIALRGDRAVAIGEVGRGAGCGCTCANCGEPLVARKGKIRRHHFAHKSGHPCSASPLETALHNLAKRLVVRPGTRLDLPTYVLPIVHEHLSIQVPDVGPGRVAVARGRIEVKVARMRVDALVDVAAGKIGGTKRLIVEIAVHHPCGKSKLAKMRRVGIEAIEIHLGNFLRDLLDGQIEQDLDTALAYELGRRENIAWLYHPNELPVRSQIAVRLREFRSMRGRRYGARAGRGVSADASGPTGLAAQPSRAPVARGPITVVGPLPSDRRYNSRQLQEDQRWQDFYDRHGRGPTLEEFRRLQQSKLRR